MTPSFHATLVNGRQGDPALYVDFRFEKRALLFDLGDLHALPPRKLLRVGHVFVSHTHIDHFIGFDQLLRLVLGRDMRIAMFGPAGIIDAVGAKLGGYTWNLVARFKTDLTFDVTEVLSPTEGRAATFRLKNRFRREEGGACAFEDGIILTGDNYRVEAAVLDHLIPCLGFALVEKAHVNVWKDRLQALGLPVGPWLRDLKQAVLDGRPDDEPVAIRGLRGEEPSVTEMALGALKHSVLQTTPGQKIAYVTDVAFTPSNADEIVRLAREADTLFIEAVFKRADADRAPARAHLTTEQAGRLARQANVRCVEPFHFSPRYGDDEEAMHGEVDEAFRAAAANGGGEDPS